MSKLLNSYNGTDVGPTGDRPPGIPRWVKVSGIITIVLILLIVIMIFIGGGNHGPERHITTNDASAQTLPIVQGVEQI